MKKNKILIIGIILMIIGLFLPSIRIANENINFLKENGILPVLLVISILILTKLEKKEFIFIPSTIMIVIIIKFIFKNLDRLNQINEVYNSYAKYQYGILVLILGNILVLIDLLISMVNLDTVKEKLNDIKLKRIEKKEKTQKVSKETTKDGKIRFNKLVVKVDNKNILKKKLQNWTFKKNRKKLSIAKFNENKEIKSNKSKETKSNKKIITNIPVIDIQKWTSNSIYCSNCGAHIKTTSEYCFLCDCKIKLEKNVNYTQKV